jgi:LacI family transcriptional regulator
MINLPHSTISDIAVLAQTTKENVARVMLGKSGVPVETQRRIVDAIRVLSTESTSGHIEETRNVIGLITNERLNSDHYTGYIAQGVAHRASELGMRLMFHVHPGEQEASHYELMRKNGLANGFIVLMPYNYMALYQFCTQYAIPLVLIGQWAKHLLPNVPILSEASYEGARAVMQHLIGLGHRRIAHISGPLHLWGPTELLRGYQDALDAAGLPFDPALVREGNYGADLATFHTEALLHLDDRPTAIFAANDVSAQGAYVAIKARGLTVGRDISVTGFDNLRLSEKLDPPLTTVQIPMHAMGVKAASLITAMMRQEPAETGRIWFPMELIVRASTGSASA